MELILQFNTEGMTGQQIETLIRRVTDVADEWSNEAGGELVYDSVDYSTDERNGVYPSGHDRCEKCS